MVFVAINGCAVASGGRMRGGLFGTCICSYVDSCNAKNASLLVVGWVSLESLT